MAEYLDRKTYIYIYQAYFEVVTIIAVAIQQCAACMSFNVDHS